MIGENMVIVYRKDKPDISVEPAILSGDDEAVWVHDTARALDITFEDKATGLKWAKKLAKKLKKAKV